MWFRSTLYVNKLFVNKLFVSFQEFKLWYIVVLVGALDLVAALMLSGATFKTNPYSKKYTNRSNDILELHFTSKSTKNNGVMIFLFTALCFLYTGISFSFGYFLPLVVSLESSWDYLDILLLTSLFWSVQIIGCIGGLIFGYHGKTVCGLISNAVFLLVGALLFVIGSPYSDKIVWLCAIVLGFGCAGSTTHCMVLLLRLTNQGI